MHQMRGESHDGKERTVDPAGGHVTYPLLYAVRTGFVHRLVLGNVIIDLGIGQCIKRHIRAVHLSGQVVPAGKRDGCIYLMGLAAEAAEHTAGLSFVTRFAQHLTVQPDDGVGGDEQVIITQRVRA